MQLSKVLKTTKSHIEVLESMEIKTVEDLILYLPRSHEDLSKMQSIATAPLDQKVTLRGTVENIKLVRTRKNKKLVTGKLTDSDGSSADLVWFNQPHIKRMIQDGDEVVLSGKLVEKGSKLQLQSPQFEKDSGEDLIHAGRLVPIYPQHDIINTKWLREKMVLIKDAIALLPENLPDEVVKDQNLLPRSEAIYALHFPDVPEDVVRARERIQFEQMFNVQMNALSMKQEWQGKAQKRLRIDMDVDLVKSFFESLKFTPTDSQKIDYMDFEGNIEQGYGKGTANVSIT